MPATGSLNFGAAEMEPVYSGTSTSKFDLTMELIQYEGGIHGTVEYCSDLYEASTITRLCNHFTELLCSIVSNADHTIDGLAMLTPAEKRQLLNDSTTRLGSTRKT